MPSFFFLFFHLFFPVSSFFSTFHRPLVKFAYGAQNRFYLHKNKSFFTFVAAYVRYWIKVLIPRNSNFTDICTDLRKSPCMWFGEVCSCCCLPLLPQLAYNIRATTYEDFFSALYLHFFQVYTGLGFSKVAWIRLEKLCPVHNLQATKRKNSSWFM